MRRMRAALLAISAFVTLSSLEPVQPSPFVGRWNMTGVGTDASLVYWLEVTESGGALAGVFLDRVAHPQPLATVRVENGELVFQGGQPGQPAGPVYRARLEGGRLMGQHTLVVGGRGRRGDPNAPPPAERVVRWIGVRQPVFPAANASARHAYGAPVPLFDGSSIEAWGVQHADRPMNWAIEDGLLTNQRGANNLVSKAKFLNFRLEAEYRLADGSNSGFYLRGRYELQVLDDLKGVAGVPPNREHMSIYGRVAPTSKASKPAGEWQTMEATVVGNRVTVILNGVRVHDNVAIDGITGGALDNDELTPGPIMVQGDHSRIWIRRMVVTPMR
jgi:hypothetical protein